MRSGDGDGRRFRDFLSGGLLLWGLGWAPAVLVLMMVLLLVLLVLMVLLLEAAAAETAVRIGGDLPRQGIHTPVSEREYSQIPLAALASAPASMAKCASPDRSRRASHSRRGSGSGSGPGSGQKGSGHRSSHDSSPLRLSSIPNWYSINVTSCSTCVAV